MTSRIRYRREKLNKDLHPHRPTWIQKAHNPSQHSRKLANS
uniref:Uncharacterized protein n=1 Tax=Anguilla anguilla TaxID=7936 RepID=A0A0E9T6D7_ANGAN